MDAMVLAQRAVEHARASFLPAVPSLEAHFRRDMTGLDAPRLDVMFTVAAGDEGGAIMRALEEELDAATRDALARNGYLKQTGDVVTVRLRSRETLDQLYGESGR